MIISKSPSCEVFHSEIESISLESIDDCRFAVKEYNAEKGGSELKEKYFSMAVSRPQVVLG